MRLSRTLSALAVLLAGGLTYAALGPAQEGMGPQVTEEHKMVQRGVGEWTGTITMHNMPQPLASPCTETVTAVGELWTTSRFEMDFGGMPFSGSSTFGYDPDKKMFVGTWVDSMTPRLTIMEGAYDKEKDAIVMHYDSVDHMTGKTIKMRSENHTEENAYHIKFFQVGEEDALQMEIEMKRK